LHFKLLVFERRLTKLDIFSSIETYVNDINFKAVRWN